MKVALAAVMLAFAASAGALPRAKSAEECMLYADLALVASTLAKHGIARERVESMLPDMYLLATSDAVEISRRILDTAYEPLRVEPKTFSHALANACMSRQGALDGILGVKL